MGLIHSTFSITNEEAKVYFIIATLFIASLNIAFLIVAHYTKLSDKILLSLKWTTIETITFVFVYWGVQNILSLVSRYNTTQIIKPYGINADLIDSQSRFYLEFPFGFIYTFGILTVLILVFKKKI